MSVGEFNKVSLEMVLSHSPRASAWGLAAVQFLRTVSTVPACGRFSADDKASGYNIVGIGNR
jgi:hypothetical protein